MRGYVSADRYFADICNSHGFGIRTSLRPIHQNDDYFSYTPDCDDNS